MTSSYDYIISLYNCTFFFLLHTPISQYIYFPPPHPTSFKNSKFYLGKKITVLISCNQKKKLLILILFYFGVLEKSWSRKILVYLILCSFIYKQTCSNSGDVPFMANEISTNYRSMYYYFLLLLLLFLSLYFFLSLLWPLLFLDIHDSEQPPSVSSEVS